MTIENIINYIGTVLTGVLNWFNEIISFVLGQPLLVFFICLPIMYILIKRVFSDTPLMNSSFKLTYNLTDHDNFSWSKANKIRTQHKINQRPSQDDLDYQNEPQNDLLNDYNEDKNEGWSTLNNQIKTNYKQGTMSDQSGCFTPGLDDYGTYDEDGHKINKPKHKDKNLLY